MRFKIFFILFFSFFIIFTNKVSASTTISSHITSDTTWGLAGSPYVLDISPNINAGVTLTIEPGVIVKAKIGKSLKIKGSLIANGTAENPIVFTSIRNDSFGGDTNADGVVTVPVTGDWVGLDFWDTSSGSILNNVIVKYGSYCISTDSINVNFNNTYISFCDVGMDLYEGVFNLTNIEVKDTEDKAIYISGDSDVSASELFLSDGDDGFVYTGGSDVVISNSTFNNFSGSGIKNLYIEIIGRLPVSDDEEIYLTNSLITNNNYGLSLERKSFGNINNNSIYNNEVAAWTNGDEEEPVLNFENNWWGSPSGPYHYFYNPSGAGDVLETADEDFDPWLTSDPFGATEVGITGLGQFKYDGIASIAEGGTNMSDKVTFKGTVISPFGQAKMQLEIKSFDVPFDGIVSQETEFFSDGEVVEKLVSGLYDANYHWRARVVDEFGNESDWIEYGVGGNIDFVVHQVPHYTQNQSPYPNETLTLEWSDDDYAFGPSNTGCGSSIAACGCAMTSGVMITRYYGITEVDGEGVTPGTMNSWLQANNGYYPGGAINWLKIVEYTDNQLAYDGRSGDSINNYSLLDEFLNSERPAIAKMAKGRGGSPRSHFIVISNKLADTYEVRDPAWYDTKTLNEPATVGKVRAYENGFDGLRLFKPGDGLAQSYFSANIASPAHLVLEDSLGRRLGYDPVSGTSYNEIPNASYVSEMYDDPEGTPSEHEWKVAYIPDAEDDEYDIYVIGTGSGPYTVGVSGNGVSGFSSDSESGEIEENEVIDYGAIYSNDGGITEAVLETVPPDPIPLYPGAKISFNTSSDSLVVSSDEIGVLVEETETGYRLTDADGDITSFDVSGLYEPGISPINIAISNMSFGGAISSSSANITYQWQKKIDGTMKMYKQIVDINDGTYSTANYKLQKTTTTIWDTLPGFDPVKTIFAGLKTLDLNINQNGTITVTH